MTRRILHMDSDIPSVYFPIGTLKSGGTCEFATKKCMKYCPSGQKVNEHEKYALSFFKKNSIGDVSKKIINDFGYLANRPYNAKMIQWFVWGDCPSSLTEKVAGVILKTRDAGIPQYGFTRNRSLWGMIPNEDRLHIGLTVDNLKEAVKLSTDKMTAHPDFEHGYAEMIFNGKIRSRCNGWWCITELETRESDCSRCMSHGEGCYFHVV